jgi:UDP-glucose 4-epimerase
MLTSADLAKAHRRTERSRANHSTQLRALGTGRNYSILSYLKTATTSTLSMYLFSFVEVTNW